MVCRSGEVGRWDNLKRPARIVCGAVGAALVVASPWLSARVPGTEVAAVGAFILFGAVLLPILTEFEIDALHIRATATVPTRRAALREICERECARVATLVRLVGVVPEQAAAQTEEAVEDTFRLWRGRVVDELVCRFLICRAVRLIRVSLTLGGPYRVLDPAPSSDYGQAWDDFVHRPALERMILALTVHAEIDLDQVAAMLDVEPGAVADVARRSMEASRGWPG